MTGQIASVFVTENFEHACSHMRLCAVKGTWGPPKKFCGTSHLVRPMLLIAGTVVEQDKLWRCPLLILIMM